MTFPPHHVPSQHQRPSPSGQAILNIRGLNTPEKRSQLLLLKKAKADVFLQETHFRSDNVPKLHNSFYPTVFHATNNTSKSKGVSILISKNCPFQVQDTVLDTNACYIFLRGKLHNKPVMLSNIYAPNKQQVPFFSNTLQRLTSFYKGMLVVGGDLNLALYPSLDSSSGSSTITYRALRAIKTQLATLTLHDTWRTLHPNTKDFTFYSSPHNKYTRIDYFFLTQTDLDSLLTATIDPMILSDHHPISFTITFPTTPTKPSWRLDNSLLNDLEHVHKINTCLKHYFQGNASSVTHPISLWAAHKCVVRGKFISLAAKRRKARQARIADLSERIHSLEMKHKQSLADNTFQELLMARQLGKVTRCKYALTQQIYYEFGNKLGKLLARALQHK